LSTLHVPARGKARVGLGERLGFSAIPWRQWLATGRVCLFQAALSRSVQISGGLVLLAVLASLGVARVPVFVDEANNVLGACQIARGAVPYRDFFSHHFPLPYYLLASLGQSGACSVLAARYLGIAALAVAMVGFTLVTRNHLAPLALLIVALSGPSYYAQMYLAETVMSVGLILTLALLTDRARRLPRPVGFALRVIALLMLASSSQIGLMITAILLPLMLIRAAGQRLLVLVSGAVALGIWPLFFAVQGAFRAFVEQAFLFNIEIYSDYLDVKLTSPVALLWQTLAFVRHRFSFVVDWLAGQDADPTVATFAAGFELGLLVLLAALVILNRREVVFRLALCLLLPLCVARDGFHLAPFVTLASLGAVQLLPGIVGRSRVVQVGTVVVVVLALRIYFFFLPTDLDAPDELARSLRPDSLVLQHATRDRSILYLPMAPDGYLANDRRPGSFYAFFLPWQADLPGAEDRLIADIERNKVAVIVLDQETPVWDKYRFREYAPRIYDHILAAYRPVDSSDKRQARVFVRTVP
jgi:hypothetical protein